MPTGGQPPVNCWKRHQNAKLVDQLYLLPGLWARTLLSEDPKHSNTIVICNVSPCCVLDLFLLAHTRITVIGFYFYQWNAKPAKLLCLTNNVVFWFHLSKCLTCLCPKHTVAHPYKNRIKKT